MEFPVDILAMLSHEELEQGAEDYMSDLLHSNPDEVEFFALSDTRQVPISLSNVGTVPMYGADLSHKLLALFAPEDPFTAVALYLAGQWWAVEDVLKTANCSRTGLLKVKTLGERVVLYALNRIVYRAKEMNKNEVPFLCHHHSDYAKVLWKDGEAIGFYSVKPKGSLCSSFLTQRYMLPVMDSIFVRKAHRGQGHGLQILEDFVDSFKEDALGLKFPLSHTMYKVCEQYLRKYPADEDLLWEVEGVGGPFQRSQIASKIKSVSTRDADENEALMDEETAPGSMVISEEIMEEVVVLKQVKVTEDIEASTHTVNELRQKRLREDREDKETIPEKINRVADVTEEPVLEVEEEQLVPNDKEALEVVTPEGHVQDEAQTVEVELVQKAEPEVNEELISSLGEKEEPVRNEVSGELTPIEKEEKEGHKDGNIEEEATQEALESKDVVAAAPEELDEDLSGQLEEAASIVEKEVPSPKEMVHSPIEEETALARENEGPLQIENKIPLTVEDKISLQMDDKDPVSGEGEGDDSLITDKEVSSRAEVASVSVEEREEMVKDEDEPEPEAPALKVRDEDVAVPSDVIRLEEAVNEELSSGSESVEKVDDPAEPCSSVDGAEEEQMVTAEDTDQDTVLLLGLKEVSYDQSTENENKQESVEKMKQKEGNASEKEDESKSENEMEDNIEIMKEVTNKKEQMVSAMEEEPDSPEKSSDETIEPPVVDMRVLRRKTKWIQPKSKRKSKRKKGVDYSDEDEDNEEEVLEQKVETAKTKYVEVEEERTTTEEEAEERSSDDEDDPPVVDRRVLRRKTKIIQSMPRTKAKRRGKT